MNSDYERIAFNISTVRKKISEAARQSGRSPDDVRLMAVSKTRSFKDVLAAYAAGVRLFGENRVQEALEKFSGELPPGMELHMIGHLQSNKVKQITPLVTCVQSVDRLKTALELNKRAQQDGKELDIMLEFNTSGENSKSGFSSYDEMSDTLGGILSLKLLRVTGLMTIGPFGGTREENREAFSTLRRYLEDLKSEYPEAPLRELSMGMSGDFLDAVLEGATMVRIGTTLFGERSTP
jgi:pyridoxal phosphate enzyme (YggS family)